MKFSIRTEGGSFPKGLLARWTPLRTAYTNASCSGIYTSADGATELQNIRDRGLEWSHR